MHTLRRNGTLTADELAAAWSDYVVVDVRDAAAFRSGHIAGALNLTLDDLAGAWPDPDRRLPVAVFAASDHDARAAVAILCAAGRDAVVVEGGPDGWLADGRAFVTNKT